MAEKAILKNAILDLQDAKAEGLLNEKRSWPQELRVHGFIFNVFDDRAEPTSTVRPEHHDRSHVG